MHYDGIHGKSSKTLTQAVRYYSDEQTCIDAVAALRWADGKPVCPKCGIVEGERKHYWLKTQKRWKCYSCRKQFSVKVGTRLRTPPLCLEVWLIWLWMLCNCRNGVSSYEIRRQLASPRSPLGLFSSAFAWFSRM